MTTRLEWTKLLADTRIRLLLGGHDSVRLPNDFRTEFERDYKRTIFSTSFRRLRDKAQVFPLDPHDAVRTRLSHSLEVSAIAEELAAQVVREVLVLFEKLSESILRSIPLVAATCGLVHDLGNLRPNRLHEVAGKAITGSTIKVQNAEAWIEAECSKSSCPSKFSKLTLFLEPQSFALKLGISSRGRSLPFSKAQPRLVSGSGR